MPDERIAQLKGLVTANQQLLHDGIRRAVYMARLQAGEAREIVRFLDTQVIPGIMDAINLELDNLADGTLNAARLDRLTRLMANVAGQLRVGMALTRDELRESLADIANAEVAWQLKTINAAAAIDLQLSAPAASTMRHIVFGDIRGAPLRDWYSTLNTSTARKLEQQLRVGIAQGDSRRQLSQRVRKVLNTTRHHAATIARTAVSSVTNESREATYRANDDVIAGVRYVATLDSRTTERCAGLDGNVYPIDEGPRPPQHHSCRSTTVPILRSWEEMGIPLKETTPALRASLNGAVPNTVIFPEWLKTQPYKTQANNLGKNNAKLFREGKLKINKYADINPRPGPLTIAQITQIETSIFG